MWSRNCPNCKKLINYKIEKNYINASKNNKKCLSCSRKKLDFFNLIKNIHDDKYDYSESVYTNSNNHIKVKCKKCDIFFYPRVSSHLKGSGCPLCAIKIISNKNKYTNEEFIEKCKTTHKNEYDYSETIYNGTYEKVTIICKIHGKFEQTSYQHLRGHGCPKCNFNIEESKNNFINKCKIIHNEEYNYDNIIYKNLQSKINIKCFKHGYFLQKAKHHMNGSKCPKCASENRKKLLSYSTEEFIQKSIKIHKDLYDYSKTIYENSHKKICIICKKHGEFFQTPNDHLSGHGCSKCGDEKNLVNLKIYSSSLEIEFLDYLNIKEENKQVYINGYSVDGYAPETNTIYEFLGDFWHGNLNRYNEDDCNKLLNNKTFKELHVATFKRFDRLKSFGYNIKYIWESDWLKCKKESMINFKLIDY